MFKGEHSLEEEASLPLDHIVAKGYGIVFRTVE